MVREGVNAKAIIAWVIGCVISFWTASIGFGFPPINGIVVSAAIYWILIKLFKNQEKEN